MLLKLFLPLIFVSSSLAFANNSTEKNTPQLYGKVNITQNGASLYHSEFILEENKPITLFSDNDIILKNAQKIKADNIELLKNISTGFSILKEKNMFHISYSYFVDFNIVEKDDKKIFIPNIYKVHTLKNIKNLKCYSDELISENPNNRLIGLKKDTIIINYSICVDKNDLQNNNLINDYQDIKK